MVPALFIANYIIEYSNEKGYSINNLKLQKLLYFVNVSNLVTNKEPLFEEKMKNGSTAPLYQVCIMNLKNMVPSKYLLKI